MANWSLVESNVPAMGKAQVMPLTQVLNGRSGAACLAGVGNGDWGPGGSSPLGGWKDPIDDHSCPDGESIV